MIDFDLVKETGWVALTLTVTIVLLLWMFAGPAW